MFSVMFACQSAQLLRVPCDLPMMHWEPPWMDQPGLDGPAGYPSSGWTSQGWMDQLGYPPPPTNNTDRTGKRVVSFEKGVLLVIVFF